jgi:hypothetical protein
VAAEFTCTQCNAAPERVVDGKATIAIVRHKLGCPTLLGQCRVRWAVETEGPYNPVCLRSAPMNASDRRRSSYMVIST